MKNYNFKTSLLTLLSDCWLYAVLYRSSGLPLMMTDLLLCTKIMITISWIITTNLEENFVFSSSQGFTSIHSIYLLRYYENFNSANLFIFKCDISQTELLKQWAGHATVFLCKNVNLGLGRPLNLLFWCFLPIFIHKKIEYFCLQSIWTEYSKC